MNTFVAFSSKPRFDPGSAMRTSTLSVLLAAALLSGSGCVRRVVEMPPEEFQSEDPPPGMVEMNAVADLPGDVWDVSVGGQPVCTTPCTAKVSASDYIDLKARHGDRIELAALDVEAPGAKRVMLIAEGEQSGKQINGIVFTMLGGMGTVVAIVLTAVGCSNIDKRGGTCTAGLITGGVSMPLTAVSIWMIASSGPQAHIMPVIKMPAKKGETPVSMALTPVGVVGTF